MGENLIQDLEKKIWKGHDLMKKWLASLVIRKVQAENTESYHFTLSKLVEQIKSDNTKTQQRNRVTNVTLIRFLLGMDGGPSD